MKPAYYTGNSRRGSAAVTGFLLINRESDKFAALFTLSYMMIRTGTFALLSLFLLGQPAQAQKKILRKLFSSGSDTSRSPSFLPLPVLGYAQETGLEAGILSLYSFYTDRNDRLTRNSSLALLGSATTKNQQNLKLNADIWSPGNSLHQLAELRFKNFPFNFYGVGNLTAKLNEDALIQRSLQLHYEAEKKAGENIYLGISGSFEYYNFRDKAGGGIFSFANGQHGGRLLRFGISCGFDNRNTNTYTSKGAYVKAAYAYAPAFFGQPDFSGGLFKVDGRNFIALSRQLVFATQAVVQTIGGDAPPFYVLPQLGNDELMRGYYTGRYRDKSLLAGQAELRYRFSPRLGLAGFAGGGNVYGTGETWLTALKPSYGAGFRYFFDVERGLSVRIDYGIGEKRPGEERQKGVYLSLGEAF